AQKITELLFSGDLKQLTSHDIDQSFRDVPTFEAEISDVGLIDLLVDASISSSKRQAREDIANGAIYINGERQKDLHYTFTETDHSDNRVKINRRRKKKYHLIKFN